MARKAGVDLSLIARIEAGRDARTGTLAKIAEALGCRLVLTVRSPRALAKTIAMNTSSSLMMDTYSIL